MLINISQRRLTQMSTVTERNRRKCAVILSDPGPEWWNSKTLWGQIEQLVRLIAYYAVKKPSHTERTLSPGGRPTE